MLLLAVTVTALAAAVASVPSAQAYVGSGPAINTWCPGPLCTIPDAFTTPNVPDTFPEPWLRPVTTRIIEDAGGLPKLWTGLGAVTLALTAADIGWKLGGSNTNLRLWARILGTDTTS